MYEFIQTATGWRVFWGVDPLAQQPKPGLDSQDDRALREPAVLPFLRPEHEPVDRPAA